MDDVDDDRLLPYRQLKDRHVAERHGLFVAEGEYLVRRLLTSPHIEVHSLLVADHRVEGLLSAVPAELPVYVLPEAEISRIVGYAFHRGMLGCGIRPDLRRLEDVLPARTLVVCPHLQDVENLGVIIRTAEALGADAMVVGDRGADPFMRRCIRVSMGSALSLPIVRSSQIERDVERLRDECGMDVVGTVVDDEALPLGGYVRSGRGVAVLLGNEPDGLPRSLVDRCTHRVTIPMARGRGADSLNVAVAAGIVLYQVMRGGDGGERV